MGLQDRDYMKREEKKESRKPDKIKPSYQKERDYSAIKYGLATIGLVAIIAILATLPTKRNEKTEVQRANAAKTKLEKSSKTTPKEWKKTVICNDQGNCKTSYSNL